jgi:hypothetical protein
VPSKLAGHAASVCWHPVELARQVWPAERPSSSQSHYASCTGTSHLAPCTVSESTVCHAPLAYNTVHHAPCTLQVWDTTSLMDRTPHTFHHAPPPRIIRGPSGMRYLCGCHVRCCTPMDDCLCMCTGCVFLFFLCSFPFLVNPDQRARPFCCLSPRVLGITLLNVWVS